MSNFDTDSRNIKSNDIKNATKDVLPIIPPKEFPDLDIMENLDKAQEQKLNLICKKLKLKPGMKVLDIGCGWGGFLKYAAEKYNVEVTGLTISNSPLG